MKYIIAWGSPVYGYEYIGPFDSHEDAFDFADAELDVDEGSSWWVVALQTPRIPYLPSSNDDPGLTTTEE